MILFIDFDGVLHPVEQNSDNLFCRTPLLWKILRACPAVDVVFSTSWGKIYTPADILNFVTEDGGEDLSGRFVGFNPSVIREVGVYQTGFYFQREQECKLWRTGNGQQHRYWLAVDDNAALFSPSCANLYLTDNNHGLTEEDAEKIIKIFEARKYNSFSTSSVDG